MYCLAHPRKCHFSLFRGSFVLGQRKLGRSLEESWVYGILLIFFIIWLFAHQNVQTSFSSRTETSNLCSVLWIFDVEAFCRSTISAKLSTLCRVSGYIKEVQKKWSLTDFHKIWELDTWIYSPQHIKKLKDHFLIFLKTIPSFVRKGSWKSNVKSATVILSADYRQMYRMKQHILGKFRDIKS